MPMLMEQAKPRPVLVPIREDVTGGIARTLWIVAAAAGLVLLVACANVANLILVRADGRQRELAVREALGAGRARVLAHFLTESALLAVIAAAGGLAVAWVAVRALVAAGPTEIPRLAELGMDVPTVMFTIVVAVFVTAICSVIPALRIGRVQLQVALREGGRSGTAGKAQHRLRGTMVALQIALALVVLAGSGLLLRTFQRLHAVRPGFDPRTSQHSGCHCRTRGTRMTRRSFASTRSSSSARHNCRACVSPACQSRLPLETRRHEPESVLCRGRRDGEQQDPAAADLHDDRQRLLPRDGHSVARRTHVHAHRCAARVRGDHQPTHRRAILEGPDGPGRDWQAIPQSAWRAAGTRSSASWAMRATRRWPRRLRSPCISRWRWRGHDQLADTAHHGARREDRRAIPRRSRIRFSDWFTTWIQPCRCTTFGR